VWVSRNRAEARTDGRSAVAADDPGMSYVILWQENGGPVRVGKLVVHSDRLVLDGADGRVGVRRELAYSRIRSIRVDRGRDERLDGRPVAVLETDAQTLKIASLAGGGELNEIVGLVDGAINVRKTRVA
jgi:hypothetical protein